MKRFLLTVAFFGILIAVAAHLFYIHEQEKRDTLRFSNTQTLDELYIEEILDESDSTKRLLRAVAIPPPPSNTSTTTKAELKVLRTLIEARTEETLAEINAEQDVTNMYFGGYPLSYYTAREAYPATSALIYDALEVTAPVLIQTKQKSDRVRPSYLDPSINPAIEIPSHAAYPSGHATQAQLIALLLEDIGAAPQGTLQADVDRIAHNREIAGVHYASDSTAGKLLGTQLFTALMQEESILKKRDYAVREWQTD